MRSISKNHLTRLSGKFPDAPYINLFSVLTMGISSNVLRPLLRIGLLMVLKQGLWRRLSSWLLPPFDPIWSVIGQNIE